MSSLGRTVSVKGEVRTTQDLTIEGQVEGRVTCEGGAVTLAASAHVVGDVLARDLTIFGRADGQMVATEVVDIRAEAEVTGRVITGRIILHDGATFNGHVEPQHLEAAVRVARYNRQKDAPATSR